MSTRITFSVPDSKTCRELLLHAYNRFRREFPNDVGELDYVAKEHGLCEISIDCPQDERAYNRLLWVLVAINLWSIKEWPCMWPGLYRSGVVYQLDPKGVELWQSIPALVRAGEGDCEDLACALAAERILQGVAVKPFLSKKIGKRCFQRGGVKECVPFRLYHVRVVHEQTGQIEDPSKQLGM